MKEKDLKRYSRRELIDIIFEQKKQEERLTRQLADANRQLEERRIQIDEAGSIAQAALEINGVFTAAQTAADNYLAAIEETKAQVEATAQKEREELLAQTDAEIVEKWRAFKEKIQQVLDAHPELQEYWPVKETKE